MVNAAWSSVKSAIGFYVYMTEVECLNEGIVNKVFTKNNFPHGLPRCWIFSRPRRPGTVSCRHERDRFREYNFHSEKPGTEIPAISRTYLSIQEHRSVAMETTLAAIWRPRDLPDVVFYVYCIRCIFTHLRSCRGNFCKLTGGDISVYSHFKGL